MMLLDRYIVRQFLINFGILLAVFIVLFVVVDLMFNFDEFLRVGKGAGTISGMLWAMWDYYSPMVPFLYVFFCGLLVVAAMGFTFAGLTRTRELTAMVTSGISMYRISAWVVIVGFGLSVLSLVDQEYVIPALATKLVRSASDIGNETTKPISVSYAVDASGNLLSATELDAKAGKLRGVSILERNDEGIAQRRITASFAVWDEAQQQWSLTDGRAMRPDTSDAIPDTSARDLEPVAAFATTLSPQVLQARAQAVYPRLLSLADLEKLSHNPAVDTAMIRQIMWGRFSMVAMNLLVLVMGLPFFLLREPSNLLLQGVKAAGVCVTAWGVGLVMLQMGSSTFNPVATAWMPVVFYLPLSAGLLLLIKT